VNLAGLPKEIFPQLAIVQGTTVILGKHLVKPQVVFVGFELSLQHRYPGLFYLELVASWRACLPALTSQTTQRCMLTIFTLILFFDPG